jgi:hypothetical protein
MGIDKAKIKFDALRSDWEKRKQQIETEQDDPPEFFVPVQLRV